MVDYTLVRVDLTFSMPPDHYLKLCDVESETLLQQPGHIWTLWPLDRAKRQAGRVHLFDNRDDASRFANGPMLTQLRDMPGIHDVQIFVYEVATALSRRTHTSFGQDTTS